MDTITKEMLMIALVMALPAVVLLSSIIYCVFYMAAKRWEDRNDRLPSKRL